MSISRLSLSSSFKVCNYSSWNNTCAIHNNTDLFVVSCVAALMLRSICVQERGARRRVLICSRDISWVRVQNSLRTQSCDGQSRLYHYHHHRKSIAERPQQQQRQQQQHARNDPLTTANGKMLSLLLAAAA